MTTNDPKTLFITGATGLVGSHVAEEAVSRGYAVKALVRPSSDKRGLLQILTTNGEDIFPNPSQLLNQAPGFYFMWK